MKLETIVKTIRLQEPWRPIRYSTDVRYEEERISNSSDLGLPEEWKRSKVEPSKRKEIIDGLRRDVRNLLNVNK